MAVSRTEVRCRAPSVERDPGLEGKALSPQVEIPGCPPIQSHNCSPISSSTAGGEKGKLMLKVVWGHKSRAESKREVQTTSQKVAFTLLSSSTTLSVSFPSRLALTL